jgi:response regulator RpfG family c-di-GMP phosphodiesterase
MNGVELLDALRAGTREQQLVPVILLTTINDVRTTDMLRADDYLPKPFNARDIVVRANMQMQLGKKRRSMEILFEERTQELRCLSEETPVGIFRCDDIGRRLFSNQAWWV